MTKKKMKERELKLQEDGGNYYLNGEMDKALECFTELVSINPEDFETWLLIGAIYSRMKQFDKAIENLEKVREHNPDLQKAWTGLIHAHSQLKNYRKAEKLADEMIAKWKDLWLGYYLKAKVLATELKKENISPPDKQKMKIFASLRKAVEKDSHVLVGLEKDPMFDDLRHEKEIQQLLAGKPGPTDSKCN